MFPEQRADEAFPTIADGRRRVPAPVRVIIDFSRRKPLGAVGGAILAVLVLVALIAPVLAPHDPYKPDAGAIYAPPDSQYFLGADETGRDVLSRLIYGARVSMWVGVVSVVIGITVGAILGVVSAYVGGKFDLITQRLVDSLLAFPVIILGLGIMSVLGASVTNVIMALIIIMVPRTARTVRSQALSVKEFDYVLAARAVGAPPVRIVFRHIMPNIFATCIVLSTITLGLAITTEASLSFLGIGVPPDVPTWGTMLRAAADAFISVAPSLAIFPGAAIALAVFGANLLGDAMRDVLDPKLRGR